jgi:hypothetical protein
MLPSEDSVLEIPALISRPKMPLRCSSDRTKLRKKVNLTLVFSDPDLYYAAQMSLRSAGEQDAAKLFKEGTTTLIRASKMRHAWKVRQENLGIKSFTRKEAGLLVKQYPWYHVPAGVHKVLMHGAQVVAAGILLPG